MAIECTAIKWFQYIKTETVTSLISLAFAAPFLVGFSVHGSGTRRGELVALDLGDIKIGDDDGTVLIRGGSMSKLAAGQGRT